MSGRDSRESETRGIDRQPPRESVLQKQVSCVSSRNECAACYTLKSAPGYRCGALSKTMTARSEIFEACLDDIVTPELVSRGFKFDRSRTYRRLNADKTRLEVINFQLGQRRLEGRFTVNLGATSAEQGMNVELMKAYPYHCRHQSRIGMVLPPKSDLLKNLPWLGMIFGARDKWWRFSENKEFTMRQVDDVFKKILDYGIPWLETRSS